MRLTSVSGKSTEAQIERSCAACKRCNRCAGNSLDASPSALVVANGNGCDLVSKMSVKKTNKRGQQLPFFLRCF